MNRRIFSLNKHVLLLFVAVFCLLLSITTLLVTSNMDSPVIRSDGKGYYLYLPAVFIHHDLTMKWTDPLRVADPPGITGEWYGLTSYRDGVYLNKYPVGLAILWLPFFVAAHLMTIVTGQPENGFSRWYQASVGVAAAFYVSVACVMIYLLLRRYFSAKVSYFTVLTLLLGTNLLSYATYDGGFTHAYSLFLTAMILYLIPRWYGSMTYRNSVLLAVLLAFAVLVRQTHVLMLIVVLLWGVTSRRQFWQRIELLWQQRQKLAVMLGVGLLVFSPQLLYWKYVTGKWLVFSYRGESFNFLHPQLVKILFSADRGFFFWAPVMLLSLIGLVLLRRRLKEWLVPLCVFLPIWLWTVASWHSWQFGESYGHRIFIDIFPLLALPIAALYARAKSPAARKVLIAFVGLCVFMNLFLTYRYWVITLAPAGTTLHGYLSVWQLGLTRLLQRGLKSGFFGLIGLIALSIGPLTHYFLTTKDKDSMPSG
jgi:hypothetical protein